MALEDGSRLGPYEILGPLGAGGMGEVYRAKDTRLDRTVAIKVLPEHLSASPDIKQRFEREAKVISSLSHPHICTLHDVGEHEGIDYLVMEHLEGETLAQRLSQGPLPMEEVLELGGQIADALDKAHKGGVVHRDLKPGNIMLTAGGVKLLDFGLARHQLSESQVKSDSFSRALTETPSSAPAHRRGHHPGHVPVHAARSRSRARRPTPAPTSSPSGRCSTRWPPAARPSRARPRRA